MGIYRGELRIDERFLSKDESEVRAARLDHLRRELAYLVSAQTGLSNEDVASVLISQLEELKITEG